MLGNKTYALITYSISGLYYIIAGIQYWVSDYAINELKGPETEVYVIFAIVTITAPVIGVIIGGTLVTKFGGYTSRKSLTLIITFGVGTLFVALPTPYTDNYKVLFGLIWGLLFFGGSILVGMIGIMLNTVEADQKTMAYSIANFIFNILGFIPSPYITGLLIESSEAY